jgi:hypothetical protein
MRGLAGDPVENSRICTSSDSLDPWLSAGSPDAPTTFATYWNSESSAYCSVSFELHAVTTIIFTSYTSSGILSTIAS